MTITLHAGDNRETLRRLIDQGVRVHSVVTDPPYGLTSIVKRFGKEGSAPARHGTDGAFARASGGFLGMVWDGTGIERDPEFWRLIWEILLPGGFVFAFSGSRTGHWQACAMEIAGFIMHPMHGWIYGCLDPETDCLTRRGWVRYTDLLPDDQVAQWDSDTGTLSWVVPTAVHEYDFDGRMVMIENRHTRQMLTPNHRVYAKVRRHSRHQKPEAYEVVSAEDIDRRPSNWHVDLPLAAPLSEGAAVDPAYAYLAGWWMTDAWAHRDANACMFSQAKPKTLAKLRAALEPHGASEYIKVRENPNHQNEHTFYLTGEMADRLRGQFPDRAIPWSVMSWDIVARRALYEGLMDGDGSREKVGQHAEAFWSLKQDRRDVFLALALSLGIRAYDDPKKGVVYLNASRSTTQVQGKHRSQRVPHKGKVWCLTVPTGAFVARRDGRPFITGNSGMPKAHNPVKGIDATLTMGSARTTDIRQMEMGENYVPSGRGRVDYDNGNGSKMNGVVGPYTPKTPEAKAWDGWRHGTQSQKPALEPIYLAQKPYSEKTGALNLLKHGVGAVNIDACRVGTEDSLTGSGNKPLSYGGLNHRPCHDREPRGPNTGSPLGRWPSNLIHDGSEAVIDLFPDSAGQLADASTNPDRRKTQNVYGAMKAGNGRQGEASAERRYNEDGSTNFAMTPGARRHDSGSAARFFHGFTLTDDDYAWAVAAGLIDDVPALLEPIRYQGKAKKSDRAGSKHPTVKPIALMEYCITHLTPKGGTVLDPFAGSGTTGEAARRLGFDCILMEAEPEYVDFLRQRFDIAAPSDLDDLLGEPETAPKPLVRCVPDLFDLI